MADKIPPSPPALLLCGCDDGQHTAASDAEDDPPNSCEEDEGETEHNNADASNDDNSSHTDTVESSDSPVSTSEASTIASNPSPSRPNYNALNEVFAQDLLNVLNACTRMHYQQNRCSTQMNEYTFANAMNSYLDGGGDINMANLYDSAREISERYPIYPRITPWREMRDVSVMTDPWIIPEESEEDDESEEPVISKTNEDPENNDSN